jgi:cytidylate kinase
MIITIDGPAGAGKSSVSRELARRLGFAFLDTGAMYRCVTVAAIRAGVDVRQPGALAQLCQDLRIDFHDDRVWLNGEDVSDAIRTPEVTVRIRDAADDPAVRKLLNVQQRRIAAAADTVTEGRDQGTEVFPDADCKFFLTASSEERARRRQKQLAEQGKDVSVDEILADQNRRDDEDTARPMGSLRPADDAHVIKSDGMTPDQVVEQMLEIVQHARGQDAAAR